MENKTPKKLSKATMFQLLLLALVLAVGVFAYYKYGNVAIVNGKAISRLSYIDLMEKQVGKQTLDQMVTEALILGAAEKQNITIPESEINASLSEVEAQVKAQGQTLDQALIAEGMTKDELIRQIRIQKLVEKLSGADKAITDAEVEKFLKDNEDQLPEDATEAELKELAVEQLESQNRSTAINAWITKAQEEATIIYR